MRFYSKKSEENKSGSFSNSESKTSKGTNSPLQFVDNRPEAITQMKMKGMLNNSAQNKQAIQLQKMVNNGSSETQQTIQKKENNTGLPDNLKTGMENLSGISLDDVQVHRNSNKPAQLQAHAYAQGTDIHLGPGQEKHLPHELGHVVQQKEGRVKPTMQMKGKVNVNDDAGLEKEADMMGDTALNFSNFKLEGNETLSNPKLSSNVIQGRGQNSLENWSGEKKKKDKEILEKIAIGIDGFNNNLRYGTAGNKLFDQLNTDIMFLNHIMTAISSFKERDKRYAPGSIEDFFQHLYARCETELLFIEETKNYNLSQNKKNDPKDEEVEQDIPVGIPETPKIPLSAPVFGSSESSFNAEASPVVSSSVSSQSSSESKDNFSAAKSALANFDPSKNGQEPKKTVKPVKDDKKLLTKSDIASDNRKTRLPLGQGGNKKIGTDTLQDDFEKNIENGNTNAAYAIANQIEKQIAVVTMNKSSYFKDDQSALEWIDHWSALSLQNKTRVNEKIKNVEYKNVKGAFGGMIGIDQMPVIIDNCFKRLEAANIDDADLKSRIVESLVGLNDAVTALIENKQNNENVEPIAILEAIKTLQSIESEIKQLSQPNAKDAQQSELNEKFDKVVADKSGSSQSASDKEDKGKKLLNLVVSAGAKFDPTGATGTTKAIILNGRAIYKSIQHIRKLKIIDPNGKGGKDWSSTISRIVEFKKMKIGKKALGVVPIVSTVTTVLGKGYNEKTNAEATTIAQNLLGAWHNGDRSAGLIIFELVGPKRFKFVTEKADCNVIVEKILPN
jgi:hypothetical protein